MRKSVQRLMGVAFCICALVYGLAYPITSYAEESDMRIEPRYICSPNYYYTLKNDGTNGIKMIEGRGYVIWN